MTQQFDEHWDPYEWLITIDQNSHNVAEALKQLAQHHQALRQQCHNLMRRIEIIEQQLSTLSGINNKDPG